MGVQLMSVTSPSSSTTIRTQISAPVGSLSDSTNKQENIVGGIPRSSSYFTHS